MAAKRLTVRQAVKIDGYQTSVGPPKTRAAIRTVGLDGDTIAERVKDFETSWFLMSV